MEFYVIARSQEGAYVLAEEDASHEAQTLSARQLGRIADRLSQLYYLQSELPLNIRIYLTAYYGNGQMEYLSVKSSPSLLLGEERLVRRMGEAVTLDGFAVTFLEDEEENRVWIGEDGLVENRGVSTQKVRQLLEILVGALNEAPDDVLRLALHPVALLWPQMLEVVKRWTNPGQFRPWLDLNQVEITWCALSADGREWRQCALADLEREAPQAFLRLDLLAPAAHYQLVMCAEKEMVLYQCRHAWEETILPEALWAQITAMGCALAAR